MQNLSSSSPLRNSASPAVKSEVPSSSSLKPDKNMGETPMPRSHLLDKLARGCGAAEVVALGELEAEFATDFRLRFGLDSFGEWDNP